jgi:hypothetical protein
MNVDEACGALTEISTADALLEFLSPFRLRGRLTDSECERLCDALRKACGRALKGEA